MSAETLWSASLTPAQTGIWYGQRLDPAAPNYTIAEYLEVSGSIDVGTLESSVERVVAETPALRLAFGEDDGGPWQALRVQGRWSLRTVDVSDAQDPHAAAVQWMRADLATPTDPAFDELFTLVLFTAGKRSSYLYQRVHHLVVDGYGAALVISRVAETYTALLNGHEPGEPDSGDLRELLTEEAEYPTTQQYDQDRQFFTERFADRPEPAVLGAPSRSRATAQIRHTCEVDGETAVALRAAAARMRTAWSSVVLAATAAYVHRTTGARDVVLALPVGGRKSSLARRTPAMLSNVVPLRVRVDPWASAEELVAAVSAETKQVLRHQRFGRQALARELDLTGSGARLTGPGVNIIAHDREVTFGHAPAKAHNLSIGPVDDLTVTVHGSAAERGLRLDFDADSGRYERSELRTHAEGFLHVLHELVRSPGAPVGSLPVLDAEQRRRALDTANGCDLEVSAASVLEAFEREVATGPDRAALVGWEQDEHRRLTFAELDERANRLARELLANGVSSGDVVAVMLPRSVGVVVCLLAAFKAGAVYFPVDPGQPAARVATMFADARPVTVLTTVDGQTGLPDGRPAWPLDEEATAASVAARSCAPVTDSERGGPLAPRSAAYLLFTSGSTGRPKGVLVEHGSLVNLLESHRYEVFDPAGTALGRRLRAAHTAPLSFDASWDPLLWMFAGHELHLVSDETRRDPEALVEGLAAAGWDALETTPSYARQLLDVGLLDQVHRPRVLALGGEPFDQDLWSVLASEPDLRVYNFYGPTESTVDSVIASTADTGYAAIGRPVDNVRAYVLDTALQPVGDGHTGELYLAGAGLARGYLHRPAASAERFVADPFGAAGERMYRTGDLVRRDTDGLLRFVSRTDEQVKFRGMRIEPGEISGALTEHPDVSRAAAVVRTQNDEPRRLVGYVTAHGRRPEEGELREFVAARLPEYMVPSAFVVLDELPLTAHGKLDTRALPAPVITSEGREPRTASEQRLRELFAEVLGVEQVGIDDDFFRLGGHSLLVTRLAARIRESLGVELGIRTVFAAPTVAALATKLPGEQDALPESVRLHPRRRPAELPLSHAQRRLWFLTRMQGSNSAYHIPIALRLRGETDTAALRGALGDVVVKHESLRTVFPESDGTPRQEVLAAQEASVPLSVRELDEQRLRAELEEFAGEAFDLTRELPLRAGLFRTGLGESVLLLVLHHIAADGWSVRPLMADLSQAYTNRMAGDDGVLTPLPLQYADYTLWQREVLGAESDPSGEFAEQLDFWHSELDGLPEELDLPVDRTRPARPTFAGASVPVEIGADTHGALRSLAQEVGTSTFMTLHAALAAVLTRMGAGTDVPIGTPVAGRHDERLHELVGFFVNTLVLRVDTGGAPSFRKLLEHVREVDLAAYAHQDVPFERVVESVAPNRSLSRHPLFQVMLALQNTPSAEPWLPGLDVSLEADDLGASAKFDLSMSLREHHDTEDAPAGLDGTLEYSRELFDEETVRLLVERFVRFLDGAVREPADPIGAVVLTDEVERRRLLDRFNDTDRFVPDAVVPEVFEEQAARTPSAVALVADDGALSFAELDASANRLARHLLAGGLSDGEIVAVVTPRSARAVVAMLAVLKAGGVYLPVDPSQPAERTAAVFDDSAPSCVVTAGAGADRLPETGRPRVALDDPTVSAAISERSGARLNSDERSEPALGDPAYVLFTSGSTGRPKGVLVEHGSLRNLLEQHRERMISPAVRQVGGRRLRVGHTAPFSFDASWDPVLWMCAGHELHVLDDSMRRDAEKVAEYVVAAGLDVLETTPSYIRQLVWSGLLETDRHRPTVLALGGEAVDASLWERLRSVPGLLALNFYGPTESTVDSVVASFDDADSPVIGTPATNTRAYVLDDRLHPAPVGLGGELYLAGSGLARGYLGRGDLSAERFVADPFAADGTRMYRTGDRARWNPQGRLEFLGRVDDQVKLRGQRIELGEIGAVLGDHPRVARAALVLRGEDAANQRLVGYFVPAAPNAAVATSAAESAVESTTESGVTTDELREFLTARLPGYMLPTALVEMAELPLNANGKLDTRALPEPHIQGGAAGRAPRNPLEEILCGLFAEVLDIAAVGVDDDFFALGGHSLLATRMVSRIRSALGAEFDVRTLFENPTVAGLARQFEQARQARLPLRPMPRPKRLPLSSAQQRLWFLNQLEEHSAAYNIAFAVRLTGRVDTEAMRLAIADLVERHETLRTVYPDDGGIPYQWVLTDQQHELSVVELSEAELQPALDAAASTGFDVTCQVPIRTRLFTVDEHHHVLSLVIHHIAGDGWSTGPLARDLSHAYAARCENHPPRWSALSVQYADYTLWQRAVLGSEQDPDSELRRQLDFWGNALAGMPDELDLPSDRRRPVEASYCGDEVPLTIGAELHARIEDTAREAGVSSFMVLQSALAALLTRLGAGEDVPVGTPVAGRTDEALEELVGFFVNTLVLRTDTSGDPSLSELLQRVRDFDLDAYANQDLPFERLVEELAPNRSLSRHPLFQVMLTLDNTPDVSLELPGVQADVAPIGSGGAKFDLSFNFRQQYTVNGSPQGIEGALEYSTDLFDHGTAERTAARLLRLLDGMLAEPDAPISAPDLLTDQERRDVLEGFNDTSLEVEGTVLTAFQTQVWSAPTETAVTDIARSLSFAELNLCVNRLARELLARGYGPGEVVGVALPRCCEAVVAMLAVLKSGAVYLPIDPAAPHERTRAMLADARPGTVLTGTGTDAAFDGVTTMVLDEPGTAWLVAVQGGLDVTAGERGREITGDDPAYVLFTSGSTGRPKGVLVEHGSLANLLANHRQRLFDPVSERAEGRRLRVGHTAPLSFDASWDPVLWMFAGHELHIVDDELRRDPERLVRHVRAHRINVLESTASYVQQLLNLGLLDEHSHRPSVIALGGEAVGEDLWRGLRSVSGLIAVNLYGPTESTVDSVVADLSSSDRPVIGTPAANTRAYVLDAELRPAPVGVAGELHLAGAGLARGYASRGDLTAERFVADPFGAPGDRMYRTGDLVRWNSAGRLEFLGRTDDQVKLRGQRVELGEITTALGEHTVVTEAAVRVEAGERLVGYVVAHEGHEVDPAELRGFLAARLPEHMVPVSLRQLDSLPLTANGKLDTRALAERDGIELTARRAQRSPRTPQEGILVDLFAEVLELDAVGVDDDFFDLGGHSLVATRLVSRVRAVLGVELSIRTLFDAATPAALAERLGVDTGDDALDVLLPLRRSGFRPPLFCVHPAGGLSWSYSRLVAHVDADRPVYGLQARGIAEPERAPASIEEMAADYLEQIRSVQPNGPYHLLGWSFGGNVVQEVAALLQQLGEEVALLTILDSYPSEHFDETTYEGEADTFGSLVQALGIPEEALSGNEMDAAELKSTFERIGSPLGSLSEDTLRAMVVNFEHQAALLQVHRPSVFDGDVLFFTATEEDHGSRIPRTWQPYVTGRITEYPVRCGHAQMMSAEAVPEIGPVLAAALAEERDDAQTTA